MILSFSLPEAARVAQAWGSAGLTVYQALYLDPDHELHRILTCTAFPQVDTRLVTYAMKGLDGEPPIRPYTIDLSDRQPGEPTIYLVVHAVYRTEVVTRIEGAPNQVEDVGAIEHIYPNVEVLKRMVALELAEYDLALATWPDLVQEHAPILAQMPGILRVHDATIHHVLVIGEDDIIWEGDTTPA